MKRNDHLAVIFFVARWSRPVWEVRLPSLALVQQMAKSVGQLWDGHVLLRSGERHRMPDGSPTGSSS